MASQQMGQGRGTLSAAAGMVEEARRDFDGLNRELVAHIDAAKTAWAGQGGSAFQALGQAWSERQRTIVGALDRFEASLRSTEHDNVQTDDVQSTAFTRSQQRLG